MTDKSTPPEAAFDPVYALSAYTTRDRQPICFAARPSGLFVSRDLGASWQYAYQSLLGDTPMPTTALAKAPLPGYAWMLFAGVPGGVLRSKDDGQTWQVSRLTEPEPLVTALAVSPDFANDGMAFAATQEDGVFVTNNHGADWASWNFGLIDLQAFAVVISPPTRAAYPEFVGVSTGLYRSLNGGRSWQPVELPCGYDAVLSLALSPWFEKDGTGFAGTENHGLLRTLDGGQTWQAVGSPDMSGSVDGIGVDPRLSGKPCLAALVDARLFISRDWGEHWAPWVFDNLPDDFEITAFAAPEGFEAGSPIWLGSSDGRTVLKRLMGGV